jgi:hypothetical protein
MCVGLIAKGEDPVCVTACPMRAIEVGSLEEIAETIDSYARSGDKGHYLDWVTILEHDKRFAEVTHTMNALALENVLLADMAPYNMGLTRDGRVVFFDAQAIPVGPKTEMQSHPSRVFEAIRAKQEAQHQDNLRASGPRNVRTGAEDLFEGM